MVIILSLISCISSLTAITILALSKSKRNSVAIIFSIIGIIISFIAIAVSAPRDPILHEFDYLGFIVSILAVFATLLLGLQLYHAFNLKEDAKKVKEAKQSIEEYDAWLKKKKEQDKISDEVIDNYNPHVDRSTTDSRVTIASNIIKSERRAWEELFKEFNSPIEMNVLSTDNKYLYDGMIRIGRELIFVDIKYIHKGFISQRALMHIKRFAESIDIGSKLLAIVTPEFLDDSTKNKYKETIAKIDNSIELRFYKL